MKTKLELLSGGNLNPVYLFMDSQNYKKIQKHYKEKMLKELKFQLNNLNSFYGR